MGSRTARCSAVTQTSKRGVGRRAVQEGGDICIKDTTIMAESEEELQSLLVKVKEES